MTPLERSRSEEMSRGSPRWQIYCFPRRLQLRYGAGIACNAHYKYATSSRTGPFSFRKEIANQAPNELKDFVPRGASLRRHAPMTQNPFMKADTHDTTASSAHRSFL